MCEDTEKVASDVEGWRPDYERRDTFEVLDHRMAELEHKVAKINRRAKKLGCPEVTLEVSEPYDVPVKDPETGKVTHYLRKRSVKVVGEPPRVEGWSLVAKLMHLDGVVIIAAVPGETVPVEFRTVSPGRCDHCHTNRRRDDTFVLRNDAEGTYKVVGRNCLADFLGGHDPKRVAAMCELMIALGEACEEEESWSCGRGYYRLDPLDVLSRTSVSIREDGWLSRTAARDRMDGPAATADLVSNDFFSLSAEYRDRLAEKATAADKKEAEEAWEWAATAGEGTDSDYLYNVRTVAQMTSIDTRLLGITCSILVAYRKHVEREIERRKAKAESKHFGTPGKREVFDLTLVGYTTCEGYYGTTHIFRFIEGEGNRATWFSSRDVDFFWKVDEHGEPVELRKGDTFTMKATVKKHESYKGVAQTVLTRVAPHTPKPKKARKAKKAAAEEGTSDVVSN